MCDINANDPTRDAKDVVKEMPGCVTFDDEVTMEDTWWVVRAWGGKCVHCG